MPITKLQPFNLDSNASYTFGTVTATNFVGNGSQLTGIVTGTTVPTVTAITYPGDDTAADTAGGQTITLTGTGFASGAAVIINGVTAGVVSVVNSTTITFTAPAVTAGSYVVYVVNTNGTTALAVPGIQYSGTPAWTTAAGTLGTYSKQLSFSANLTATGDAPITYSVLSGTLPSGITLTANTGVVSGTTPNVASSTTYNFTIRSTDAQLQDTDRAFSITVVPLNPPPAVQYLVVAGGGAGGGRHGGGGGAGGLLQGTASSIITGSSFTVTVGAGAPTATGGARGGIGSNSILTNASLGTITTYGGGGGGVYPNPNDTGLSGGSGGGGGSDSGTSAGGLASPSGQGNAGGSGVGNQPGDARPTGGGGGAGAAGTNGSYLLAQPGNGGVGVLWLDGYYYAGGGGGGNWSTGIPAGNGGLGGGGGGGMQGHGPAGTGGGSALNSGANGNQSNSNPGNSSGGAAGANTGGGGGGAGQSQYSGYTGTGGAGGSGAVVVRYADTYDAAASTTGSPTVTVAGGFRLYRFTTSGSITF